MIDSKNFRLLGEYGTSVACLNEDVGGHREVEMRRSWRRVLVVLYGPPGVAVDAAWVAVSTSITYLESPSVPASLARTENHKFSHLLNPLTSGGHALRGDAHSKKSK